MHSTSHNSADRRSADDQYASHRDRSTSREDHRGSHFTSRMLITKQAAKETENDAVAIKNRIAMLEKEEQKLLKQIDDAKKQARDIISKKSRNTQAQEDKRKALEERGRELRAKHDQILNKKEEMKERVQQALEGKNVNSKTKAEEIKDNMKVLLILLRN